MLSYVRYTIIAMSVVFLLATSVTAAMSPHNPTFINVQRSANDPNNLEPANDGAELAPNLSAPIVSEPVAPSLSAPLGTLPTAVPPNSAIPPQEINPRQNPADKK